MSSGLNYGNSEKKDKICNANLRDQRDVDAAASQVEYYIDNKLAVDFSIVVVNYGNCSFSGWPKNVRSFEANHKILDRDLNCDTLSTPMNTTH